MLFARYAYPPNSHGFCGPGDAGAFFEYGVAGADDRGLRDMAQQFAGAWPYLELIAGATGLDDPLDRRVVEAYWVGSPRLDQVSTRSVGNSMEERFRRHDRAQVLHPHRERAGRRRAASQLRGVLHLPVDRAAERPAEGEAGAHRARPLPDPLGPGDIAARRPGGGGVGCR